MWPFKPTPTRSSACSPVRPSGELPVRPSARSWLFRPRPLVHPSARAGPRPCLLGPIRASSARLPVRSTVRTLSAPVRPTVRGLFAPSAYPLVCSSARPPRQRPSARPPIRSVHASSATSARPVRSARVRQPPLYIPHPASPQIIQLLAVRIGPRVSVAPLRTAALRGAQGLREVGVNCGGNPCNFFFAQQATWRGRPFTSRETGLQQ